MLETWKSSSALLFDKDGTIVDFKFMWLNWCEEIVQAFDQILSHIKMKEIIKVWGVDLDTGFVDPSGLLAIGSSQDLIDSLFEEVAVQIKSDKKARQLVTAAIEKANKAICERNLIHPVDDIVEVIKQLYWRDYYIAIVTADDTAEATRHMEILNLEEYIHVILGCDQVKNCKPAPDLVLETCRRLKVQPSSVTVIGDTVADMIMAKEAGATWSIGVTSGVTSRSSLNNKADMVLENAGKLIDFLG